MDWLGKIFGSRDEQQSEVYGGIEGGPAVSPSEAAMLGVEGLPTPTDGRAMALLAETIGVGETSVKNSLADADAEIEGLATALLQLDEEWSAKMGEYVQRNAQLRVDAKQATRKLQAAEADLMNARNRIKVLEDLLEDTALKGDESIDQAVAGRTESMSLDAGSGGVDLRSPEARKAAVSADTGIRASPTPIEMRGSPTRQLQIDADTLIGEQKSPEAKQQAAEADAAEAAAEMEAEKAVAAASYAPQGAATETLKAAAAASSLPMPPRLEDAPAYADAVDIPNLVVDVKQIPKSGGGCVVS